MPLSVPNIRYLPVSTHTAVDAAAAVDCELGQIAKSLIFYNVVTGEPILIIASGVNRVDKAKIGEYLGFKIKTAGPEYVLEKTGYLAGGVPPFSHLEPIRTLLDQDLLKYDSVYASAGTSNSLFAVAPNKLVKLSGAEVIPIY